MKTKTLKVEVDCKQANKELRSIRKKIRNLKKDLKGLSELISCSFNVNVTDVRMNQAGKIADRANV